MRVFLRLFSLLLLICLPLFAQHMPIDAEITFLNKDSIYINKGSVIGLKKGDKLLLVKTGITLEVVFTSRYSSSCVVVDGNGTPKVGDRVDFFPSSSGEDSVDTKPVLVEKPVLVKKNKRLKRFSYSGYLRTYTNHSAANHTYSSYQRQGIRSSIKLKNLGLDNLNWVSKFSYEKNGSNGVYKNNLRLYEMKLDYTFTKHSLSLGRMASTGLPIVSSMDGAFYAYRFTPAWSVSSFFGRSPTRYYYRSATKSLRKVGGYFSYSGDWFSLKLNSKLGALLETEKQVLNRKSVVFSNSLSNQSKWSLYQTIVYDLIGDWQKSYVSETSRLSQSQVNLNYKINDVFTTGASHSFYRTTLTLQNKDYFNNFSSKQLGTFLNIKRSKRKRLRLTLSQTDTQSLKTITSGVRYSIQQWRFKWLNLMLSHNRSSNKESVYSISSVKFSQSLFKWLKLNTTVRSRTFNNKLFSEKLQTQGVKFELRAQRKKWSLSSYFDKEFGDSPRPLSINLETSVRL